jgi:kynurenine formamidase
MRRIVDLSYPIHNGMTTFPSPWHPLVEVSIMGRHGIENRETRKLVLGTHIGTHCDAPRHMVPGGETIENVPMDLFVGPARVLDCTAFRPGQPVAAAFFEQQLGDRFPERLVLRFDWSDRWGRLEFYANYPYLAPEAAQLLVRRGVRLLAMDTPAPDHSEHGRGSATDSPIHKILLGNGVILVEYLCNLRELRKPDIDFIFMPLKIVEGDGAPGRCVAIEDC